MGYDFSVPNAKPGRCAKCRGTGVYAWGGTVNGKAAKSGPCFSCQGTGRQLSSDIYRNRAYNKHKIAAIAASFS